MVWLGISLLPTNGAQVEFIQVAVNDADGSTLGAVASDAWQNTGIPYSTVTAPAVYGSYRFACWSVNSYAGMVFCDPWGRSRNPVSFVLLETTTATAHYLPATNDTDGDGVPDWYEREYYGTLTNGASYDGDGDGLTMAQEYGGGTHPLYANTTQSGGVFWADSPSVTCNLAGYSQYIIRSEPTGSVHQAAIVTTGTVITTPSFSGNASFGYWTLDGVRQQDAWGVAYPQFSFTVSTNNREAVAYLFAGDSDGDGVPDAYEQYIYGTLTNGAASDTDGDGVTLAQEYGGGTHPLYANTTQPGSVFWADSPSVTCNLAGYSQYVLRSDPAGSIYQTAIVTTGTVITTPTFSGNASFGYWTLDGVRQQDAWGVAYPQFSFTVSTNNREAVVYLFAGDSDGDAIPDAYEQYIYGTLTNGAASDTDGDGVALAQEYAGGTHPLHANTTQPGGVFWADSPSVTCNLAGYAYYVLRSEPAGVVNQSSTVSNGTVVTTPFMGQATFGFWALDGARQADAWGVAVRQFSFTMGVSNREAVAYFFGGDGDGDGVSDAIEYYYYGHLTNGAASDTDGDGITLASDPHPLFGQVTREGGVFWAQSSPVIVNLQGFDAVQTVLLTGVPTPFFSASPTGTLLSLVATNSHPALGDWDGDGDMDLFVGGAGGVMRIFENAGSPRVLNLVERSTHFTSLAFAWTNVVNPSPALGDWSGDGKADLAVGGGTGGVWLVESSGTFDEVGGTGVRVQGSGESTLNAQQPTPNDQVGSALPLPALRSLGGAGLNVQTSLLNLGFPGAIPAFADIDHDGWVDLLVLTGAGRVQCHTHTGAPATPYDATPSTADLLGTAVPNARGLTTADVNGDGVTDVLVSDDNGNIWEFHGAGGGP